MKTNEKAKAKYAKSRKFCGFERKYDRGCEQRKRNDFDGKVYAEPGKHVFDGHNGICAMEVPLKKMSVNIATNNVLVTTPRAADRA